MHTTPDKHSWWSTAISGSFLANMPPVPFILVHLIPPKCNTLQLSLLNSISSISDHFSNSSPEILNLSSYLLIIPSHFVFQKNAQIIVFDSNERMMNNENID